MKEIKPIPLTESETYELAALQLVHKKLDKDGIVRFLYLWNKYTEHLMYEPSGIEERIEKHKQMMRHGIICGIGWNMIAGLNEIGEIKDEIRAIFYSDQIEVDEKTGLCTCDCADPCPLHKTGCQMRCTEAELMSAGITPRYT